MSGKLLTKWMVLKRGYAHLLKFDPGQPRNERGRWVEEGELSTSMEAQRGKVLDAIMKHFGADWMAALLKLEKEGALEDVIQGRLAVERLRKREGYADILKFDPAQPRDEDGKWVRGAFRSSLEQKRRNFWAHVKRIEHSNKQFERRRQEMIDAWKAWADDTKNRKKPLKPDGAAAKKLDSYKKAKALEDALHQFSEGQANFHTNINQGLELLKVPVQDRSKLVFEDDAQAPLHPTVVARARQMLENFKQFDGSGAFVPMKFEAARLEKFKEVFGPGVELEQYEDGTFAIKSKLKLGRAENGRAHATFSGINVTVRGDMDRQIYHEVAHHIEMKSREVLEGAIALRESLASKPREEYKLKEKNPGLGDDEVALRGNFPDPYTAKLYPQDISTEMVSTGVESYLSDPITFARTRPEHFNFIFDVMHGKYRSTP
jgi:hypothetical protein